MDPSGAAVMDDSEVNSTTVVPTTSETDYYGHYSLHVQVRLYGHYSLQVQVSTATRECRCRSVRPLQPAGAGHYGTQVQVIKACRCR